MGLSLALQLAGKVVKGTAQGLHSSFHVLYLVFVLSQLSGGFSGLFCFPLLCVSLIFLKLLVRFFFFSFDVVLYLLDLRLQLAIFVGLVGCIFVLADDGVGLH
jgi:hypothetical protein